MVRSVARASKTVFQTVCSKFCLKNEEIAII
jgi:hypothetical protein